MEKSKKKRKITISFDVDVPDDAGKNNLGDMVQEVAKPLQKTIGKTAISELKKTFGKGIGNITIKSLHDEYSIKDDVSPPGYTGKIWAKATC